MGVVNATPDSFSDGGIYLDPNRAVDRMFELQEDGAHLIDLGAESTRPGAAKVSIADEWSRLEPIFEAVARRGMSAPISLDTRNPENMRRGVAVGVRFINDVSGLADEQTLAYLATIPGLNYLTMHMHGTPNTMQQDPLTASDAKREVDHFFQTSRTRLIKAGFNRKNLWFDPGIGFGKTDAANLQLLARLNCWRSDYQLAVGISRKGFVGRTLGIKEPLLRDKPTKMLEVGLAMLGARLIRTHEVAQLATLLGLLEKEDGSNV